MAARATEAAVGADLALRRGELETAAALAAEAEEAWALLGEPGPAAVQARLRGDVAALAGQPALVSWPAGAGSCACSWTATTRTRRR